MKILSDLQRLCRRIVKFDIDYTPFMRYAATCILVLFTSIVFSQSSGAKLKFDQGQKLEVSMQVKSTIAQQAMGQAIDFSIDATGDHSYTVTNTTPDNTTLHHEVSRLRFIFDGMGQKRSFDSKEEKDMNGPFGKMAQDMLDKSYDMVIDTQGSVLMVLPEKIVLSETDTRMAVLTNMLGDVFNIVQPPGKNEPGFFRIFPNDPLDTGLTWGRMVEDSSGKLQEVYKITAITDSTVLVDYAAESVTITRAEMMGNVMVTTMNNKSTGKIEVDKASGIIRTKNIRTESNGSSEAPFGTIPVTSKSETLIQVRSVPGE